MQDYQQHERTLPTLHLGQVGRRLQQALVEHLDEGALPFNAVAPVHGKMGEGFPALTARPQPASHWAPVATPPHVTNHGFATERNNNKVCGGGVLGMRLVGTPDLYTLYTLPVCIIQQAWHSPQHSSGYTTPGGARAPPPVRTSVLHGGSPMSVQDYSSPTNSAYVEGG